MPFEFFTFIQFAICHNQNISPDLIYKLLCNYFVKIVLTMALHLIFVHSQLNAHLNLLFLQSVVSLLQFCPFNRVQDMLECNQIQNYTYKLKTDEYYLKKK